METDPIAAIRRALTLLDAGADNPAAWQSAIAMLHAGGVACEDRVKAAIEVLQSALPRLGGNFIHGKVYSTNGSDT